MYDGLVVDDVDDVHRRLLLVVLFILLLSPWGGVVPAAAGGGGVLGKNNLRRKFPKRTCKLLLFKIPKTAMRIFFFDCKKVSKVVPSRFVGISYTVPVIMPRYDQDVLNWFLILYLFRKHHTQSLAKGSWYLTSCRWSWGLWWGEPPPPPPSPGRRRRRKRGEQKSRPRMGEDLSERFGICTKKQFFGICLLYPPLIFCTVNIPPPFPRITFAKLFRYLGALTFPATTT